MKRLVLLIVLLGLSATFCTGFFFSCDNCEDMKSKIFRLEEENHELRMTIEDNQLIPCGVLEAINSYLYGAEEYLNGQFLDVDPSEALRVIQEAEEYLWTYMN